MNESPCKCIVVAPAYRLNIFGFLASASLCDACADFDVNLGFWDQRLALQWTYENIDYFGGNASNITLGGYSAGSHSVFHQIAYDLGQPDSKAIVKRALMLSNGPGMQPKSLLEAQGQFEELLGVLNIPLILSPAEQLACVRAVRPEALIKASHKMKLHQFRAVTDGTFVRHGLLNELSDGSLARSMRKRGFQLIIGECSDEHHVYGTWRPPNPGFDNMLHRLEADYPQEACRVLMAQYFPEGTLPSKYKSWQVAFGHIYADVQIYALDRGMVSALVKHGVDVFRYRIEWRAKCVDLKYPKNWGATHTSDMPLWFWGNGATLDTEEKEVARRAIHDPLSRFLDGRHMGWGTQHAMQLRTLKSDGTVACEDDLQLEQGLVLWNALKKVGATGQPRLSRL